VADFDRLVKAYDIRGTVPDEMNAGIARDVGALFVRLTGTSRNALSTSSTGGAALPGRPWAPSFEPWC